MNTSREVDTNTQGYFIKVVLQKLSWKNKSAKSKQSTQEGHKVRRSCWSGLKCYLHGSDSTYHVNHGDSLRRVRRGHMNFINYKYFYKCSNEQCIACSIRFLKKELLFANFKRNLVSLWPEDYKYFTSKRFIIL